MSLTCSFVQSTIRSSTVVMSCQTPYADQAAFLRARILAHELIATDTWRVRVECPAIARKMVPGQFVMLRIDGCNDPLIGRALAMYDRVADEDGQFIAIDLAYLVKGKFTQALSKLTIGAMLGIWGPLGNGFCTEPVDDLILVVGGVGYTPMLTLGREALGTSSYGEEQRPSNYAKKVTLCYGARSADRLAGLNDFLAADFDVRIATDDGSLPKTTNKQSPMLVTEQLKKVLFETQGRSCRVACCGPEPMMEAVSKIAMAHQVPCQVSLETPMACGIGICFTCVAKIRQADNEWDYRRTCLEGPVFNAESVVW
jgi:dihydroorotate dehydrogenase electron transfer subunit